MNFTNSKPIIACFSRDIAFFEAIEGLVLEGIHADFIFADTVAKAISCLEHTKVDLIISGHLFLDGTSQHILKWLCRQPKQNQVPFILLTSFPLSEIPDYEYPKFRYLPKSHLKNLRGELDSFLTQPNESL